ncbi:MAG: hypothetical protein M4579_002531 [Chaenotheca gracillima]|nr:MAG: hypothetical protein M4579_002531 [Chaenotheca gracillima]
MSNLSAVGKTGSFLSNHSPADSAASTPDSPYRARSTESLRPQLVYPERQSSLQKREDGGRMPSHMTPTESEFEALPPAIRRKYFSTLERLRFAHHVSSPPPQKTLHFPKPAAPPRLLVNTLAANAAPRSTHMMKMSKKQKRVSITQADAQWYLSLPEKVRRKQFTREEQVMLAGTCETVILDATDEALYRIGRPRNRSLPSIIDSPTRKTPPDTPRSQSAHESHVDLPEPVKNTADDVSESPAEDWFRWVEEDDDYDSPMGRDSYHANIVTDDTVPPLPKNGHSRRPSFRRGPSLELKPFVPLSVPQEVTKPTLMPTQASPPPEAPRQSLNLSNSANRPNAKAAALTGDPEATYYQDPEARLKLRMYLGSAQKFDEALEFGFPSIDGANLEISKHERAAKADKRRSGGNNTQTFLNDDYGFLFDDGDDSSVPDVDEPPTPSEIDITFRAPHHRRSGSPNPHSSDSFGNEKLFARPKAMPDPYAQALAGGREMTLRMTLTKPELRGDEDKFQQGTGPRLLAREKTDPLALGDLPPLTEDPTGTSGPFGGPDGWGPLPKDDGILKKFWKKVRHGPR